MPKQLPATSLATMSRSPPPHALRSPVSLPRALSSFKIPLVGLRLSHPPSVCLSLSQSACLILCLLPLRSPLLVSRIAFSFSVPSPGAVLTSILSRVFRRKIFIGAHCNSIHGTSAHCAILGYSQELCVFARACGSSRGDDQVHACTRAGAAAERAW